MAAPTRPPTIHTTAGFLDSFRAPNYVIRPLLQEGFLYSLTAKTGVGKTSIALRLAMHVATGRDVGHFEVAKAGRVLFLAGENPTDIQMRVAALVRQMGLDAERIPIDFIAGTYDIKRHMEAIIKWSETTEGIKLVVIDTAIVYFPGKDENDNVEMSDYAKMLRRFVELKGHPAVVVVCHPVKKGADTMPRGGGALLNEVDGNLICSGKRGEPVRLHWAEKFRGPNFEPQLFELKQEHGPLKDDRGLDLPTMIAIPMELTETKKRVRQQNEFAQQLAAILPVFPGATLRKLATELGWFTGEDRQPYVARVKVAMLRLVGRGLVKVNRKNMDDWKWIGDGREVDWNAPEPSDDDGS